MSTDNATFTYDVHRRGRQPPMNASTFLSFAFAQMIPRYLFAALREYDSRTHIPAWKEFQNIITCHISSTQWHCHDSRTQQRPSNLVRRDRGDPTQTYRLTSDRPCAPITSLYVSCQYPFTERPIIPRHLSLHCNFCIFAIANLAHLSVDKYWLLRTTHV